MILVTGRSFADLVNAASPPSADTLFSSLANCPKDVFANDFLQPTTLVDYLLFWERKINLGHGQS